MWIYILLFIIVICLAGAAQYCFKIKRKAFGHLFLILATIIPSILSGCRDLNIGTDVNIYLSPAWQHALHYSSIIEYIGTTFMEPLFGMIIFIFAHYTSDIHWLLFGIQLLIMLLVYKLAYHYRQLIPIWIIYFLFLLLMYQLSFNMMRQAIALLICINSFKYVEERKFYRFLAYIIIGLGFHITTIIFSVTYFFYFVYNTDKSSKWIHILQISVIFLSIIFVLLYNEIILLAVFLGILKAKYLQYTSFGDTFTSSFSISEFIIRAFFFCIALYNYRMKILDKKSSSFFLFISFFELLCNTLSLYSTYASRITLYFFMLYIIYIPRIIINSKNKPIFIALLIILLSYYWYYLYIINKVSDTYPYTSSILNIN